MPRKQTMQTSGLGELNNTPYSPDFAPSDFSFLPDLKGTFVEGIFPTIVEDRALPKPWISRKDGRNRQMIESDGEYFKYFLFWFWILFLFRFRSDLLCN